MQKALHNVLSCGLSAVIKKQDRSGVHIGFEIPWASHARRFVERFSQKVQNVASNLNGEQENVDRLDSYLGADEFVHFMGVTHEIQSLLLGHIHEFQATVATDTIKAD